MEENQNNYHTDDSWSGQAQYRVYEEPVETPTPKKPSGNGKKVAQYIAIALVFGVVAGGAFASSNYFFGQMIGSETTVSEQKNQATLNKTTSIIDTEMADAAENNTEDSTFGTILDVSGIASSVMPSIVAITNVSETQYQDWFGQIQNYQNESAGSGIIVSQDEEYLYIATNNHVVEDATSITVQFIDDTTVSAEIKGADSGNDLAVVAVKRADIEADTIDKIRVATLGDSDGLKVGQASVAIGNALGYGQSVTTGVISALNREVSVTDETTGTAITNELIQTDAAINPGNSGGALLNLSGEVIGINSVKYTDTTVEGMGYAIPINTASPIIEKLITREVVDENQTAYLGISGVDVSESVANTYNMPEGIYVYQIVSGSAADQAGLAQGDIITQFDGTKVTSTAELEEQMHYYAAGTQVDITIQRLSNEQNGQYSEQTITVTLGRKN